MAPLRRHCGKARPKRQHKQNEAVLPYFRISRVRANEILSRIERTLSQWRETGLTLGITNQELDQFVDAFEHPEREAARQAAQRGA